MNHSPEPWTHIRYASPDYAPQYGIYSEASSSDIAIVKGVNAEADSVRIVACVNACAGITNPDAIPELVEALGALVANADLGEVDLTQEERALLDNARAALRNAKGQ